MAYREVTMIEVKEILRLWLAGVPKQRIAQTLRVDRKTVGRYIELASEQGLGPGQGSDALTDAQLEAILVRLKTGTGRPHGEAWERCVQHRAFIKQKLEHVKLSKVRRLLRRQGVHIRYPTLHRFAVAELGYGRRASTIPVADGEPDHARSWSLRAAPLSGKSPARYPSSSPPSEVPVTAHGRPGWRSIREHNEGTRK